MIPLKRLKTGLTKNKTNYKSDNFFDLHRYLEAYIKRVFLIGLRLQSVQYGTAKKIVEHSYIPIGAAIDKGIALLDQSGASGKTVRRRLRNKYSDFFVLSELFKNYTSKYRNRYAHGAVGKFKNQELVNCLCHIDRSFFVAYEKLIKSEYGSSAFDFPRDWGAKMGINETEEAALERLTLDFSITKKPMSLEDVTQKLENTDYRFRISK